MTLAEAPLRGPLRKRAWPRPGWPLRPSYAAPRVRAWTGRGRRRNAGETEPVFRENSWILIVDRQEGNRFVGSHGLTNGSRRDPILAVIREDRRTIHMVDDDGTFTTILTGPDTLEMCRTEVTAVSRIVGCRQLTRQK